MIPDSEDLDDERLGAVEADDFPVFLKAIGDLGNITKPDVSALIRADDDGFKLFRE